MLRKMPRTMRGLLHGALNEGLPAYDTEWVRKFFFNPFTEGFVVTDEQSELDALGHEDEFSENFHDGLIVDFDWRFSNKTIRNIISLLREKDRVLFVGCPTLFFFAKQNGFNNCELVERNPLYGDYGFNESIYLQSFDSFLSDASKFGTYDAVIMDPPWYLKVVMSWLDGACLLLRTGGELVISVYPPTVRPNAALELNEVFRFLSKRFMRLSHGISIYNTPTFEKEVFFFRQIKMLQHWRRGIIMHCRNLTSITDKRWINACYQKDIWQRRRLQDRTVLAVRDCGEFFDKNFRFFNSVSSRHPDWDYIRAVTSKNMVVLDGFKEK